MTHDQTTPAPVEVRDTRLTRPIVGIKNRTAQEVFDIMCDRIAHSAPAGEVEPVLRWEELGYDEADLYLGDWYVGCVRAGASDFLWVVNLSHNEGREDTLTEARTAAEQAVRDWLARAGLYTHPAPPADLVEVLARLADAYELLCKDTNQRYDLSPTSWLVRARAVLAKHGGA